MKIRWRLAIAMIFMAVLACNSPFDDDDKDPTNASPPIFGSAM
jgi:hypothetical protein